MTVQPLVLDGSKRIWGGPKCVLRTRNGRPCPRYAKILVDGSPVCQWHVPRAEATEAEAVIQQEAVRIAAEETATDERLGEKLIHLYESLSTYRRVPPPENMAHDLLRYVQEDSCLMCWVFYDARHPYSEHLVKDHDHRTGMVRSLLCKMHNTQEGLSSRHIWTIYEKYAPANGWFYRYYGRGQQWENEPDPIPARIKIELPPRKPVRWGSIFASTLGPDQVPDPDPEIPWSKAVTDAYIAAAQTAADTPIPELNKTLPRCTLVDDVNEAAYRASFHAASQKKDISK